MQGWVGAEPDSLWNAFSKLSQDDIDEVRKRLKEEGFSEQPRRTEEQAEDDEVQVERRPN